jgi:hypothetical protein
VFKLSQDISDGFQANKPANRMVLTLLDFSKACNKVWRADLLATMLRKGVPVRYVDSCPIDRQGFASTGLTAGPG